MVTITAEIIIMRSSIIGCQVPGLPVKSTTCDFAFVGALEIRSLRYDYDDDDTDSVCFHETLLVKVAVNKDVMLLSSHSSREEWPQCFLLVLKCLNSEIIRDIQLQLRWSSSKS